MTVVVLLRVSVPFDPLESGAWVRTSSDRVVLALALVPFAGIAFLWFIGVLRDRLGAREDRFFATIFLGSGLLFLGLLFVAAAVAGAAIMVDSTQAEAPPGSGRFSFARALTYGIMNIYAVKMAAVFMFTTSTMAIWTGIAARWIAYLGYALAVFLLFGGGFTDWTFLVFPLWVLLMSSYILVDNLRRASGEALADVRAAPTESKWAWASGKVATFDLCRNWSIVFVGNFVGAFATAVIMFLTTQYTFGGGSVGLTALNTASAKAGLEFVPAVALGIMCNAIVCLAAWMCYGARTSTDRILTIVPPIAAFAAVGFEHCIANMYFIPIGLFVKAGAPDSFWAAIGKTAADFPALTWENFSLPICSL